MKGLNDCRFIGHLSRDGEFKMAGDIPLVQLGLAVSRAVKDQNQDSGWRDEVEWVNVVCWRPSEYLKKRLLKGNMVYIQGRLQTRSWDADDGTKRYKTEIICNGSDVMPLKIKPGNEVASAGPGGPTPVPPPEVVQQAAPQARPQPAAAPPASTGTIVEDEVPF